MHCPSFTLLHCCLLLEYSWEIIYSFFHQVFKLIYACRLAEAGLCAQAFHYCEVISKSVLVHPSYYSPVFISQVIQVCFSSYWKLLMRSLFQTFDIFLLWCLQMSEKLRFFDPQLKEKPEQELFIEPEWLIRLRQLDGQIRVRGGKRFCFFNYFCKSLSKIVILAIWDKWE